MKDLTQATAVLAVAALQWVVQLLHCFFTAVQFVLLLPELWALGQRIQMAQRPAGSVN